MSLVLAGAIFGAMQLSLFVARALLGEVQQLSLFVAGAFFGEVQLSLCVAGAFFGEIQLSLFVARALFGEVSWHVLHLVQFNCYFSRPVRDLKLKSKSQGTRRIPRDFNNDHEGGQALPFSST